MKKAFLAVLLTVFTLSLYAAADTPKFSAKLVLTKAVNVEDQFAGILPERPPFFPFLGKVAVGEPFRVYIVFYGAKVRKNTVKLKGELELIAPDGKKQVVPLAEQSVSLRGDSAGVFLLPQHLGIVFEPKDPVGTHKIALKLVDQHARKTAKDSASVELTTILPPPVSDEKAFQSLTNNYRSPSPQNILPAFRCYLKKIPEQQKKEKNYFNPIPQLAFFCFLLQENPQMVKPFADMVAKLTDAQENFYGYFVLNFVSPEAAKYVPAELKKQFETVKKNPFVVDQVSEPWQLDVCWAEFMVRGTRAPVLKVLNALSLVQKGITVEDYKKIAKPSPEDQRKLMNGLVASAAQWSIQSISKQHPLLKYYIEAVLKRQELKDPIAMALAAKAIGMEVRINDK